MKTTIFLLSVIFAAITDCLFPAISFSQINFQKNIFGEKVFVENKGQFNSWAKTPAPVKYAVNNSDNIFFTQQGLTFKLEKINVDEKELEEALKKGEPLQKNEIYYVNMQWDGCNANPVLEASETSEGYYTFGETGYENVKAKGYRKLTYKELYPGIDAEYIIPEKGGIKYSLIIHPGADASKVKMKYSGDVDKIEISADGNILIKTPAGYITDHAPKTFYEGGADIKSAFGLASNTVSFKLQTLNSQPQTIIVDPWTITPTSLVSNNAAFDIDYDNNGNVYVSGGSNPYHLSKFTNAGTFLWTFTNPAAWGMYTRFCLLRNSGTVFIGRGFSSLTTTNVMKISTAGILQFTSAPFSGTCEIWKMFYNQCTKKLIGFGGGIFNPNSLQLIADTNLTSSTAQNFNGYGNPTDCCNDIASVDMDDNGDFYALMTSSSGIPAVNNRLMKSLNSAAYNPPSAFDVATGYNFDEPNNFGIPGFAGQTTVRANAVSLNSNYVFSYDGRTLIAWNKTTGANLGSVVVSAAYTAGKSRSHEGIDVDPCNTVYVGGKNQVHVFSFNGTAFTAGASITTTIPNEVYDVCLGPQNKLYVCGAGFVSELLLSTTVCNQINLAISSTNSSCSSAAGSATVTATGGTAPYTYTWNPSGQTTATATGLAPGTYTVSVTDAAATCNPGGSVSTATVTITAAGSFSVASTQTNIGCGGSNGSIAATVTGGASPFTYSWSPSGGNTATATGLTAGAYTLTVTDANGCVETNTATITSSGSITATAGSPATICAGQTVTLNSSGGQNYIWSSGQSTSVIAVVPTTTTTYSVIVSIGSCADTAYVTITVNASPVISITGNTVLCIGDISTLTATGGTNYSWNTGSTSAVINVSPGTTTTYSVVSSNSSCTSTAVITVIVAPPPVAVAANALICEGQSATLTASGGVTYLWSNGATASSIIVAASATSTYTVIVSAGSCADTASATVVVNPSPTATAWNSVTITSGASTTLAASGGGSYTWSNGDNDSVITVSPPVTTVYCVTVLYNNCTDTACVTVQVEPIFCGYADDQLFVPDAFSPNGDTKNDMLGVYYPNLSCIKEFIFIIYDRWGEKVFEATNIAATWDGAYKGKAMNTAVFVYYMKVVFITGTEVERKGNVSLIR